MNALRMIALRMIALRMMDGGSSRAWAVSLFAFVPLAACAPASMGTPAADPTRVGERNAAADSLVPPGYGTLKQDELTVSIRSGATLVKVTPLDEATIRVLAPDTYSRLHALREAKQAEATRTMMRPPELFMVSFFSYQPDVTFQPEDLQLLYQSRLLRAQPIMPLTNGWGRQRLAQQETQTAIYAFEGPIDYGQVFSVRYGLEQSEEWRQIVPKVEAERAKILSRVR